MPLSPDFTKMRKAMRKKYGKEKGDEVFWGYVNKHKLDETKPMSDQKAEATAELLAYVDADMEAGIAEAQVEPFQQEDHGQPPTLGQPGDIPGIVPQPTPTGDPTKPQGLGEADTDRPITIAPGANDTTLPATAHGPVPEHATGPYEPNSDEKMQETAKLQASADKVSFFSIPAYHFSYSAAPRIGGSSSEIGIKAIVLEEDPNVNNWEVGTDEFPRVAAQYKAGKPQLRVDHSKDMNKIIGKAVNGVVLTGAEIPSFMGRAIPGINPDGLYVGAEFVADPQDPQIRTNILNGYVVTGSIGLDAEAFCKECQTPLKAVAGEMKRQCAHLDAPIYLKNIDVKEWSYVAEPAYEHTQAFPSFAAAMQDFMSKEQTTKERNKLEEGEFAYPEERKLPINDAAHVRNALARWNQTDIPSDKKSAVLGRICRAAKKFGIESDLCKEKGKAEASGSSLLSTPAPTIQMSTSVEATAAKKPPMKDDDEDDVESRAEAKFQQYKKAFAEGMKFRAKSESEGEGEAKAESEGEGEAKAESESEGEGEAKAESEGESEGEADAEVTPPSGLTTKHLPAKGARKTDQISKSGRVTPKANKVSYLEQALHPTDSLMAAHPEMREIFKAAAEAPGAPEGARALRSRFS